MSDTKQCSDHAQTGPGFPSGSINGLSDPKSPSLNGSVEQTGVPTGKQGR